MSSNIASIVPDYANDGGGGGSGGSGVNSVTGGLGVTVTGTATDPILNANFRPANSIYVSPNGSNTNDGSILAPFLSISKALNLRSTISADTDVEIFLYAGNYAENVVINVANTSITAYPNAYETGATSAKAVSITGNITVEVQTLGTQGAGSVAITGINIIATSIITSSLVAQGLYFRLSNCKTQGFIQNTQSSSQVYSAQYSDCYMVHTGDSSVITSVGVDVAIIRCDIFHTNALTNPTINVQNGTSRGGTMNMQYSKVVSSNSSATVKSIVRYQNTSATSGNLFSYNTLSYSSQTTDTGGDKCCIQFNQTAPVGIDYVTFNGLDCDGASYTGGQPYVMQKRGTGSVTINVFGGNYGGQSAHTIDPAITRTSTMILV